MTARIKAGERIRQERVARRWTVMEAAERADLSPKTWTNIEDGRRVWDITRVAVSLALGWNDRGVDRLLEGLEPEPGRVERRSGVDRRARSQLFDDFTDEERVMARAFIDGVRKFRAEHPKDGDPNPDGLDWLRNRYPLRSDD